MDLLLQSNPAGLGDLPELPEDIDDPTLDESMDNHFTYIQDISTPQELEQLLPRLQSVLYEVPACCIVGTPVLAGGCVS